jgi:predicted NAD/FAD-binding protein
LRGADGAPRPRRQCEWGSNGLGALFAQRRNAASPAFARMLYELTCFEKDVLRRDPPARDARVMWPPG